MKRKTSPTQTRIAIQLKRKLPEIRVSVTSETVSYNCFVSISKYLRVFRLGLMFDVCNMIMTNTQVEFFLTQYCALSYRNKAEETQEKGFAH